MNSVQQDINKVGPRQFFKSIFQDCNELLFLLENIAMRGAMGRGNTPPQHGYGQRTARRSRGRPQRPYGRF